VDLTLDAFAGRQETRPATFVHARP